MPTYLTKPVADALCTLVAAGYIKDCATKTKFEYAVADGSDDYAAVGTALHAFGITFTYGPSRSQDDMPYIVAKTGRVPNIETAKVLVDENSAYLRVINQAAYKLRLAPRGAYIGGLSTVSRLFILGPSTLTPYLPRYRSVDPSAGAEAKKYYDDFKQATNDSLTCLDPTRAELASLEVSRRSAGHATAGLGFDALIPPITAALAPDTLFSSYHGMVHTMVTHQTEIDRNAFIFEIALGEGTTKVSSCFPCCTFMTANGTPPTSTHLGRGDYWGIPDACTSSLRRTWQTLIANCYASGKASLKSSRNIQAAVQVLDGNIAGGQIADVFLEALTFPGSFASKIISTLPVSVTATTTALQPRPTHFE